MPTTEPSQTPGGSSTPRRALRAGLSMVFVVAIFVGVLPRIADLSEVWASIAAMTATEVAGVLVVAGWNLVSYWLVQMIVLPGLGIVRAAVATQSSTALANTLPAGAAVGMGVNFAMFSAWGFPRSVATRSLLLSGIWNNFAKIAMPVVALALLARQGDASAALLAAALAGVGMLVVALGGFALLLRSDPLARRVGGLAAALASRLRRIVRRPPVSGWDHAAARFRTETIGLLRVRWVALTAATVISHVSLYLVLLVSLRTVGVASAQVDWAEVLGAFAFVRLVSALPITPGGLGVVEVGLAAALVVAGGDHEPVVAGVLVYRALTYLLPIPLGALTYAAWCRERGWRRPPAPSSLPLPPAPPVPGTSGGAAGSGARSR